MSRVLAARARKSNVLAVAAVLALPQNVLAMEPATALNYFAGHTISGEYADGGTFIEQFRAGGTTIYADDNGIAEGMASVENGRLCFAYAGGELAGGCFTIERKGVNCFTFYGPDGAQNGWTARAWRTDGPSTCEDVPTS